MNPRSIARQGMNFARYRSQFRQIGHPALAILLIALVLFLTVLASSESLHKLFHSDADSADHHCAAVLFAHGQIESATIDFHAVIPAVFVEAAVRFECSVFSTTIDDLPPGRGPPTPFAVS